MWKHLSLLADKHLHTKTYSYMAEAVTYVLLTRVLLELGRNLNYRVSETNVKINI